MDVRVLSQRKQKARKQYRCYNNHERILPGDYYIYTYLIMDGEARSDRMCLACYERFYGRTFDETRS